LRSEIEQEATNAVIMDFDRSWWTIREKLDAYFEAAETQLATLGKALQTMDDYTSKCTKNMHDLKQAHALAARADETALAQLRNTWLVVEQEGAMMAARMADGHGFLRLGRSDVLTAELHSNRSVLCVGGSGAIDVIDMAVEQSLKNGLALQTWTQWQGILADVASLEHRFVAANIPAPKAETWDRARDRVQKSFDELKNSHEDMAFELAATHCKPNFKLEAALQFETDVETMNEKLRRITTSESELETKLASLKNLLTGNAR